MMAALKCVCVRVRVCARVNFYGSTTTSLTGDRDNSRLETRTKACQHKLEEFLEVTAATYNGLGG
jgi:hypothetical protein